MAPIDAALLRAQVGMVLQDNFLFNLSARENIALAAPHLSMEQVAAAADLAGAHDFIMALPQGYDTKLGERGAILSAGQLQRIALARRSPPIRASRYSTRRPRHSITRASGASTTI